MAKTKKKPTPKKLKSVRKPKNDNPPEPPETHDDETGADETGADEESHRRPQPRKKSGKRGIGPLETENETAGASPEKLTDANKPKDKLRGKTGRLPGMEDAEIEELEDQARTYVSARDERMACTETEVEEKTSLLGLMKKYDRKSYRHGEVEIKVVAEEETVKVRIIKEKKQK